MLRRALPAAVVAACLVAGACGGTTRRTVAPPPPPGPGDVEVKLLGLRFSPEEVALERGSRVVWTWTDSLVHNIVPTGDRDFAGVGTIAGPSHAATFTEPGRHTYTCTLHQGMDGVVVVR